MERERGEDHRAAKEAVRSCREKALLDRAFELAALDDRESEAMRMYVYRRVPICVIAERMGYHRTYFSRAIFKKALVKYVYCLKLAEKEKSLK